MGLLGALLRPINPGFLTEVATTFGSTVWVPSPAWLAQDWDSALEVLWHEATHVEDWARLGLLGFALRYAGALPLVLLAPLALLGLLWAPCWLFALALLAALPWPTPGRVQLEARAYAVSLLVRRAQGRLVDQARADYAAWLAGPEYYWASWAQASAEAQIRAQETAGGPWAAFVREHMG